MNSEILSPNQETDFINRFRFATDSAGTIAISRSWVTEKTHHLVPSAREFLIKIRQDISPVVDWDLGYTDYQILEMIRSGPFSELNNKIALSTINRKRVLLKCDFQLLASSYASDELSRPIIPTYRHHEFARYLAEVQPPGHETTREKHIRLQLLLLERLGRSSVEVYCGSFAHALTIMNRLTDHAEELISIVDAVDENHIERCRCLANGVFIPMKCATPHDYFRLARRYNFIDRPHLAPFAIRILPKGAIEVSFFPTTSSDERLVYFAKRVQGFVE